MNVFKEYSQYYDLLYSDKDYESEASYISELIKKYNPKAKSIIELGCGTGKHASILSKKGYKIHAIDLSQEMLNEARGNFDEIVFEQGDVRYYRARKKFDAAISLFHVASYQTSNQDLRDFFKTADHHLEIGGIFVFDLWYGPAVLAQKPSRRLKNLENNSLKIKREAIPHIDYDKNIVEVKYNIAITKKHDLTELNIEETHKMRYLFLPEIELFCEECNFKILNVEEWLTKKPPSPESWGICIVVVKTK